MTADDGYDGWRALYRHYYGDEGSLGYRDDDGRAASADEAAQARVLADGMAGRFMDWLGSCGLVQDGHVQLPASQVILLASAFGEGFSCGARAVLRSGPGT